MTQSQAVEHFVARHIAEHDRIAFAAGFGDGVNVGLHREIFLIMGCQEIGDQLADPAKTDDDRLLCLNRQFVGNRATTAAHFHASGNVVAEPGQ